MDREKEMEERIGLIELVLSLSAEELEACIENLKKAFPERESA